VWRKPGVARRCRNDVDVSQPRFSAHPAASDINQRRKAPAICNHGHGRGAIETAVEIFVRIEGREIASRELPQQSMDAPAGLGHDRSISVLRDNEAVTGQHGAARKPRRRATVPHHRHAHVRSIGEMQHAGSIPLIG
jgi:hypothetical protein